jgi:hypothetical protein
LPPSQPQPQRLTRQLDKHRSIERFHRTLSDGWAYARFYDSETARREALPGWMHFYNHYRAHSAIGGLPPISRLTQPVWASHLERFSWILSPVGCRSLCCDYPS